MSDQDETQSPPPPSPTRDIPEGEDPVEDIRSPDTFDPEPTCPKPEDEHEKFDPNPMPRDDINDVA